ncbi:MAG TPA: HK97 family phage prohead protease [Archangium sp.]|uniref:HK97 family phage prohead protease n=1 Tax=Archangium sp. TaxID=1872627 RepID=UPI002E2FB919|nr:HK97 family phage prohead protease [Archangium sp.]HEX5750016.1 HK97 family phage prohead protease [Archangium sp.]
MKLKPTPPADGVIKALGQLVQKAEGAADAKPVFRITSEVLDRHRDRVKTGALKTENFDQNPVLLWNHNDWEPAIGTCRVFQESGEWFMEPAFDGIGELSKDVAAKVAAGTLRTCSIRFRFLKYAYNEEGGLDYEEVELLEVSITNIPANPEALRVKNQAQQQKQKTETPPPAEGDQSKALEQADLDAIRAAVDEAMKPCMEAIARIEAALTKLLGEETAEQTPGEEEASTDAETPEEAASAGDGEEMTSEEEEELKSFLDALVKPKAK